MTASDDRPGGGAEAINHNAHSHRQEADTPEGTSADDEGAPTRWEDLPLSPEHVALLVASGIAPEQAGERGYETITTHDGKRLRDEFGFSERVAKRAPGLLIPRRDVFGNRIDDQFGRIARSAPLPGRRSSTRTATACPRGSTSTGRAAGHPCRPGRGVVDHRGAQEGRLPGGAWAGRD